MLSAHMPEMSCLFSKPKGYSLPGSYSCQPSQATKDVKDGFVFTAVDQNSSIVQMSIPSPWHTS